MSDTKTKPKKNPLEDPRVTKNDDGSYTVTLAQAVQLVEGDAPLTSLTLRRVKGRAMVSMLDTAGEGSRLETLMLASAGLVGPKGEALIDNVDGSDFLLLIDVAATFLGNGQTTGQ
ncbi:hypothetical protein [Acetobacter persici]|uniref:hypothetical protein n=1 Tax=Acetobacter persici TaxID=1076596 RepID=UPI001BA9E550|nr:hypothetical protein [Acetobacter persici]MBS1016918.1 hypothetical protein [Acetobacter persici]